MQRLTAEFLRAQIRGSSRGLKDVERLLNRNVRTQSCLYNKDNNDEDGGGGENASQARSNLAKKRLDSLLQSIVQDSKKIASDRKAGVSIDMKLAAQIKEKPQQAEETQEELEEKELERDLGKDMVAAVKKVAETVSASSPEVVESELVQKLKTQVSKKVNLSDLFSGMKIDRTSKPHQSSSSAGDVELSRAHRVRRMLNDQPPGPLRQPRKPRPQQTGFTRSAMPKATYSPIDLFGAPPLGIFKAKSSTEVTESKTFKLETWDRLAARDLKMSVTHPPANGFEEMILWTEQGKLWKFPIDNEQGMDEEAKVPFHEHVFLESQLTPWCPTKGPIRHFMELVCVGLSKNPFLTVKEKHEQIEWYHQYFKEKAAIIKDIGAGEIK